MTNQKKTSKINNRTTKNEVTFMKELRCPKCGEKFQIDEAGYAAILKQVRDEEFSKELESRERQFESDKKQAVQVAKLEAESNFNSELSKKEAEIAKLEAKIKENELVTKSVVNETAAEKTKKLPNSKTGFPLLKRIKNLKLKISKRN